MIPLFSPMTMIMTLILLIVGYLALIRAVNRMSSQSYYSSGNEMLINVVLAVMYLVVCGVVGLLYVYSGFNVIVIYGVLAILVLVMLVLFLRFCLQNRYGMRGLNVALFLIYMAAVLYLTVFMRIGVVDDSTVLTTPFDDLQRAVLEHDPEMMEHMMLNVVMFIPFGYLIPAMNPDALRHWSFAMLGGLMSSTVIEGTQMILHIGQADIDDIIANTLGAVIGYILVRFVWQFQRNWEI